MGIVYLIGEEIGLIFYCLAIIAAKILLETVNYIEHYGLVRESDKPVHPRHSWNANNVISSLILYFLKK